MEAAACACNVHAWPAPWLCAAEHGVLAMHHGVGKHAGLPGCWLWVVCSRVPVRAAAACSVGGVRPVLVCQWAAPREQQLWHVVFVLLPPVPVPLASQHLCCSDHSALTGSAGEGAWRWELAAWQLPLVMLCVVPWAVCCAGDALPLTERERVCLYAWQHGCLLVRGREVTMACGTSCSSRVPCTLQGCINCPLAHQGCGLAESVQPAACHCPGLQGACPTVFKV